MVTVAYIITIILNVWFIFAIPLYLSALIPAYFIGMFLSNVLSKRTNKDIQLNLTSDYHKKWMIGSSMATIIILIFWFIHNYLTKQDFLAMPVDQIIGINSKWNLIFTLDNMSPILYLPLFTTILIFIIATILHSISKAKNKI